MSDLARATWQDWTAATHEAVEALTGQTGKPVAIVGASMGALLAIHVARRRPQDVAALVLLAPPLRFKPIAARGLALISRVANLAGVADRFVVPKAFGADIRDSSIRATVPTLRQYPLKGLATLADLMTSVAADLEHVRTPVMLVHGRHDRTVARTIVDEVASRLTSTVCERVCLERSGHLVALDYDRQALGRAVVAFINKQERAT